MRRFPLRAIVVIKRGETNTIRRLTPAEAADHFFHQTYFPSTLIPDSAEQPDAAAAKASGAASAATVPGDSVAGSKADAFALRLKALDLMGRLTHLPIYELHCTISQAAVTLTLGALQESIPK